MNSHALFYGSLIAALCGLVYHLLRGGSFGRLILYVMTAWVMFFAGQLLSEQLGWTLLRLGSLNLFPSLLAVFLGLILLSILTGSGDRAVRDRRQRNSKSRRQ
jgi:hypothetical protein